MIASALTADQSPFCVLLELLSFCNSSMRCCFPAVVTTMSTGDPFPYWIASPILHYS